MNKTVQFLVEGISKDILSYIIEDNQVSIPEACALFHNSDTFSKLVNKESGLYIESSAYVYEIFKDEMKYGKITM